MRSPTVRRRHARHANPARQGSAAPSNDRGRRFHHEGAKNRRRGGDCAPRRMNKRRRGGGRAQRRMKKRRRGGGRAVVHNVCAPGGGGGIRITCEGAAALGEAKPPPLFANIPVPRRARRCVQIPVRRLEGAATSGRRSRLPPFFTRARGRRTGALRASGSLLTRSFGGPTREEERRSRRCPTLGEARVGIRITCRRPPHGRHG